MAYKLKIGPAQGLKLKGGAGFALPMIGGVGIKATKSGGIWTVDLDYTVLTPGPVSDPTTAIVAVLDQSAGIYKEVSLASLLTSGLDADLQAIAALTSNGILARTADDMWALRTITGTANEITVTNGDGVSGNPTLSLPNALTFTDKTVTGGTYAGVVSINGNIWTAGTGTLTLGAGKTATISNTLTFTGTDGSTAAFGAGGTVAYQGGTLAQFAATTSAQLAGVISDETGTGALVFATSPTLVTPTLGAASATSINKVALTAPATSATLTIADGKTLTASDNATVSGTNTGDQTITLTGDVTGSGTGSFATTIGATKVTSAMLNADVFSTAHSWSGVQTFTNPVVGTQTAGDNSTKAASTAFVQAAVTAGVSGVASLNGQTGALKFIAPPQGRLTLASGVPVMAATQASKTTIYYTPYVGNQIPIYDGTNMVPTAFSELSIATTDTTYNPAAIGANKVNDWFVWNDSGTLRLSHGPDWTSDAARSAGTALVMVNGVWLNNADITNGPAALRGTYVGTTRSDVANQLNWILGGAETTAYLHVFNAYNRKFVSSSVSRSGTWSYSSATVRGSKGDSIGRINFVSGLPEEAIKVDYLTAFNMGVSNQYCDVGFAMDSTTTYDARAENQNNSGGATISMSPTLSLGYKPVLGAHFISGNENGDGVNNTLFIGSNMKNQLTFTSMM